MLTKRFNPIINILILWCSVHGLYAQELTLAMCYELGEQQSPLINNTDQFDALYELDRLTNWTTNFPVLMLSASASYQSDVFQLPFDVPGAEVPEIPKDQYVIALSLSQKIYDGGLTRQKSELSAADREIKQAELDVSLYRIREWITSTYFGILILQENEKILQAVKVELNNQIRRGNASYENGIILKSDLSALNIEYLKNEQQIKSLDINKKAFYDILSQLIGEPVDSTRTLLLPDSRQNDTEINRPELAVFDLQSDQLSDQQQLLDAGRRPKVAGFAKLGYAQPNQLNFFEPDFSDYYILGLKMEWKLLDWGLTKRSKEKLGINQQIIQNQKQEFISTIDHQVIRKKAEIDQLRSAIDTDKKVLALQTEINREARDQLDQGAISATDYVSTLAVKTQMELRFLKNETELSKSIIELNYLMGDTP